MQCAEAYAIRHRPPRAIYRGALAAHEELVCVFVRPLLSEGPQAPVESILRVK